MRKLSFLLLVLAAACGGKSHPAPTPPVTKTVPTDTGAQTYGGDEYGDEAYGDDDDEGYGGDEYGGDQYGGLADNQPPPAPVAPVIAGTWKSDCVTAPDKSFRRITFTNTDARWDLHVETFADDKCATRQLDLHQTGPYTLGAASAKVTNAWEGTFSFDAREITADDAKTAKKYAKLCKVKLKKGAALSIHDKGCAALGVQPVASCAADNDVVAIDGDRLRFGVRPADNNLCTADKRPTALDTTVDVAYQWKPTTIPECDTIFVAMQAYIRCSKLPAGVGTQIFESMRSEEGTIQQQASNPSTRAQMVSGCQQAASQLKTALSQMGC